MRTSDDTLEPIVQLPNHSRNEHVSTHQHLRHEEEATRTQYPVAVAHLVSESDEEQISPPSSKKKAKKKKKKHTSPEDEYQTGSDDEQVTPPSSRKKKKKNVQAKEDSSMKSDEKQASPSSSKRKKKKEHIPPEEVYSRESDEEQASPLSSKKKKKKKKHIPSEDDYDEALSPASSKKKKKKENKAVSASETTPEELLESGGTTNQFITYNNNPGYTQLQPTEQTLASEPKNSYPQLHVVPPAAHLATANQYLQQPQLLLDTEERSACGCSVAFVTISIVVSAILATVCLVLALFVIWHPGWVVVCFIASVVLFIVTCGCLCGLCCVNRD